MPGAERRDQPSSLSLSGAGGASEDISLRPLFCLNILLFRSALFAVIAGGDAELPRQHFGKIIAVEKSALMGDVRNGSGGGAQFCRGFLQAEMNQVGDGAPVQGSLKETAQGGDRLAESGGESVQCEFLWIVVVQIPYDLCDFLCLIGL